MNQEEESKKKWRKGWEEEKREEERIYVCVCRYVCTHMQFIAKMQYH